MAASGMVIAGGVVATVLGIAGPDNYNLGWRVGHLLMVLIVSSLTLLVAGVIDGGRRYLGSGLALLYVGASVLVISHLPNWVGDGWVYGLFFIVWGSGAIISMMLTARSSVARRKVEAPVGAPSEAQPD